MNKRKKFEIKNWMAIIILLISSISITILSFLIQPNGVQDVIDAIKKAPIIFIYNFLPIILIMLLFYFVFNNVFVGTLIGSSIITLLSIINRYKIIYRDDPLVPMDMFLGTEAISIMVKTKLGIDFKFILLIILIITIQVFIIIYTKREKLHYSIRIIGIIICIIISFISYNKIYSSKIIYEELPVKGHQYLVSNNFNTKGFIYCFLYNISAYTIDKPQGYNQKEVEEMIKAYNKEVIIKENNPHVIMIMGEAFTDISLNENFRFGEEDDPLRFYKQIQDENILNGYITVPNFGGGTANTEFDVLTGCATLNISESSTSAFRLIRKTFDAIPHQFKKINYTTLGIHPGYDWFYNRRNVYNHLGFEKSIFENDFNKEKMKGNFISEEATIDRIIEEFEKHINSDNKNPIFEFCVTIQNHNPYVNSKYKGEAKQTFDTDLNLSEGAKEQFINYFEGIKDADNGIERLVKYFETIDEPVILVYFGDHLPYLGSDYLAYKEIGYDLGDDETTSINTFKTPFFIWGNEPGKSLIDVNDLKLPEYNIISSNYFGALIFDLIGYKDISPFISYVNELRKEIPIIAKNVLMVDNKFVLEPPEEIIEKIEKYKKWQYYQMK